MKTKRVLLAVLAAGAAFGVASAVQAAIPDSSGVAHGCYLTKGKLGTADPRPGDLRLIDTDAGKTCAADEQPVDLATTGFVTSTVNQTAIMGQGTFTALAAGNWYIFWTCGGWVATTPTVDIDPLSGATANTPITLHGMVNTEEQTSGFPGTTVRVYFSLASTQNVHTQVTCVDPRVYGETAPVSAPTAQPKATLVQQ